MTVQNKALEDTNYVVLNYAVKVSTLSALQKKYSSRQKHAKTKTYRDTSQHQEKKYANEKLLNQNQVKNGSLSLTKAK